MGRRSEGGSGQAGAEVLLMETKQGQHRELYFERVETDGQLVGAIREAVIDVFDLWFVFVRPHQMDDPASVSAPPSKL